MHMNDGRVVSNFVIQALQNEPITVRSQPTKPCAIKDNFVLTTLADVSENVQNHSFHSFWYLRIACLKKGYSTNMIKCKKLFEEFIWLIITNSRNFLKIIIKLLKLWRCKN